MNPVYERIKESVSLQDAMRMYGIDPGTRGNTHCPFHGDDKHPSLNVRNNFYFCHTCGAHGDVIGFVSQLFGIRPSSAAIKLDNDFHLNIIGQIPNRVERSRMLEESKRKRRELEKFRDTYRRKTLIRRALWLAYIHHSPDQTGGEIDCLYAEALRMLPVYDNWFEENPYR